MDANIQLIPSPLMSVNFIENMPVNIATFPLVNGTSQPASAPSNLSGHDVTWMRMTLICTTADTATGMVPGDEVDAWTVMDGNNLGTSVATAFSCGSNATLNLVYASYDGANAVATPGVMTLNWKGSGRNISSFSNFSMRIYWQ